MKTSIILNPKAGGTEDDDAIATKLRSFPNATLLVTDSNAGATQLARAAIADGAELIVAAGGDGTLNEVVNGVAEDVERLQVGLIPLGTGNDFARMLGLPDGIDACLEVLRAGVTQSIDMVRVTSNEVHYFVNVSAGGFSGTVGEKLTPEIKQTWGPLAYLRCAAEALPELRAYHTEITLDDSTTLALDLYNVIIANGRYVGGGTLIAPDASLDDGQLDVVLIPQASAGGIALVLAQILAGKHLTSESVVFRRAAKIAVHSTPGMCFNVDGELVGNEPALFEVMPRALRFITPAKKE